MPEPLTRRDVVEIARLARLELTEDEIESLGSDLAAILEHVAVLQSLDTDGVPPMTHAVPMNLRLRADEVGESLPVETALGAAPQHAEDHFQVPNIIKTGAGDQ